MSRSNKSKHALLALLSIGPRSGYDIERDVRTMIGHFWNESFGQIYPALRAIVAEGLATVHEEVQEGKPNRKVYTITREGRSAVREWLEMPPDPPPVRNEMLLKLFVGWQASPNTLESHVAGLLEHFSAKLEEFSVYEKIIKQQAREDPDVLYWHMTLRSGQLYMESRRKWCEETLVMLKELAETQRKRKLTTAARTKKMAKFMTVAHEAVKAAEQRMAEKEVAQ